MFISLSIFITLNIFVFSLASEIIYIFILQLFKEDPETGLTHMALSSDSTCVNHLYSSQDGYETLHMEKIEQPQQPQDIMVSSARCEFPKWMKGTWEGLTIGNNGEFSFRDEDNFVTYRGHCVTEMPPAEENLDGLEGQRYLLFLSTDCGTTSYSCALFQRRDVNVLEFQLGKPLFQLNQIIFLLLFPKAYLFQVLLGIFIKH